MATPDDTGLLELEVGAIAAGGGCVARAPDGLVVFVRHTLPGERVRARVTARTTSYLRADAVEILTASPDRVDPPCPHAGPGRCGGCDFQHVELGAQRRLKGFLIAEQLARLAGIERTVEVEPVPGDTDGLRWRNRVRLAVDGRGAVGFRRHRSHQLEHVDDCPIAGAAVSDTGAFGARWPGAAELEIATGTEPGEAVISVTPRRRETPRLPAIGTGLVIRGKVRRPPGALHAVVRGHTYRISPGVFWQAHTGAAEALLAAVLDLAGDCRAATVLDLYAGAGLFSVPFADAAGPTGAVLAVERDARACADARHNGAAFPCLRVTQAEVTPALVASARRPSRPRRPRPGSGGRRHRGHACAGRPRHDPAHAHLRLVRPGLVRTRRPGPPRRRLGPDGPARLRHLPHDRARGARRRPVARVTVNPDARWT